MANLPEGGRVGQSMAIVHDVAHNRLVDLRNQAQTMQRAMQGRQQRAWQIPQNYSGSVLDIANLHTPAFDRTEINTQYEAATNNPKAAGTNGDVISLKLQIDYNACEERAFRARHTTLCRAMCLGHGRRIGQGQGSLWSGDNGIEAVMAAFIAAGGAAQNTTETDE